MLDGKGLVIYAVAALGAVLVVVGMAGHAWIMLLGLGMATLALVMSAISDKRQGK